MIFTYYSRFLLRVLESMRSRADLTILGDSLVGRVVFDVRRARPSILPAVLLSLFLVLSFGCTGVQRSTGNQGRVSDTEVSRFEECKRKAYAQTHAYQPKRDLSSGMGLAAAETLADATMRLLGFESPEDQYFRECMASLAPSSGPLWR